MNCQIITPQCRSNLIISSQFQLAILFHFRDYIVPQIVKQITNLMECISKIPRKLWSILIGQKLDQIDASWSVNQPVKNVVTKGRKQRMVLPSIGMPVKKSSVLNLNLIWRLLPSDFQFASTMRGCCFEAVVELFWTKILKWVVSLAYRWIEAG